VIEAGKDPLNPFLNMDDPFENQKPDIPKSGFSQWLGGLFR
jgi:hypothetical protein